MDIQKSNRKIKKDKKYNGLLKIRDDFYVKLDRIHSIERVDRHPSNDTILNPEKYLIKYKDSVYNWSLVTIEEFENNIKPFI